MNKFEKIAVMIGPPGVGKNTIGDLINNNLKNFSCLDGDSFISPKGIKRLQTGLWNDDDRREYLSLAAIEVTKRTQIGEKLVLADAMTTNWMREHFENQIRAQGNFILAWILVTREFAEGEIEKLVAERAKRGHPINSVEVFQRYSEAFEPITQPYLELRNPGPKAGENKLLEIVKNIFKKVYED